MTFRELLDKYRAGQASEEERALVEAELEKSEAIADYLAEQVEDALGAAETQAPAREVRHIQKKVNRRLRRTAVWAACIVLAVLLGVRFVVSPLVSSLYYQPNAYTVVRIIVGADALRTVAAADLQFAPFRIFGVSVCWKNSR